MRPIATIIFSMLVIGSFQNLKAQPGFQKFDEVEGVNFYYKWKASKILKQDSPQILILKLENNNKTDVRIDFLLDYFWESLRKASSSEQSHCIKAGKRKKGKLKKLGFDSSIFTREQLQDENFSIEVSVIKITNNAGCTH